MIKVIQDIAQTLIVLCPELDSMGNNSFALIADGLVNTLLGSLLITKGDGI